MRWNSNSLFKLLCTSANIWKGRTEWRASENVAPMMLCCSFFLCSGPWPHKHKNLVIHNCQNLRLGSKTLDQIFNSRNTKSATLCAEQHTEWFTKHWTHSSTLDTHWTWCHFLAIPNYWLIKRHLRKPVGSPQQVSKHTTGFLSTEQSGLSGSCRVSFRVKMLARPRCTSIDTCSGPMDKLFTYKMLFNTFYKHLSKPVCCHHVHANA